MDESSASPITLIGRLVRKQTFGDWAVGVIEEFTGQHHKVVGTLIESMELHQPYELKVNQVHHAKHGPQLEAQSVAPYIELERSGLNKHLVRNFNGVGPKTASEIIKWYEDNSSLETLRNVLAYEPWKLHGFMTAGTAKGIEFIYQAKSAYSYLYTFMATRFGGTGVADPVLRRLSRWLSEVINQETSDPVGDAFKYLAQDPYKPMLTVMGYRFSDADKLAGAMGGKSDDPVRLAALAFHALRSSSANDGHTYIPIELLRKRILESDFTANARQAIEYAVKLKYPLQIEEESRCYDAALLQAENDCAAILAGLLVSCYPLRGFASEQELRAEIRKAELIAGWGFPLDPSQSQAVISMLHSNVRLHTLTAGPGRGKTTTMEVFAQVARVKVVFCAPTGKAAKILHARVSKYGFKATTIHQLLEPSLTGFLRNEERPLEHEMVVVDEASMVELEIMRALLLALLPGAHLVLMGDKDQLNSVGAGNVLQDVLALNADHQRLNVPHRNEGAILQVIESLRKGDFHPPPIATSSDVLHLQLDMKSPTSFEIVMDAYLESVLRNGLDGTALLVPNRKGKREVMGWNTTYLNQKLQAAVNANGEEISGTQMRIGDRIIIKRNMEVSDGHAALIPVVNGDTGFIKTQQWGEDGKLLTLQIDLDDGRKLEMGRELLDQINLAYAMTVHEAQGSEYQCVICVVANGPSSFLNRSVFYTAASRAKRELQIFGSTVHLQGIAKRIPATRFSALTHKVNREKSNA